MRALRYAALAAVFCLFLAAGLWLFAPWETLGRYALDQVRVRAAENGMFISYADFRESGRVFPTYTVRSLDIDQGMVKLTLPEARVRVLPVSSVFFGGLSCYLSFTGGEGVMIPEGRLRLGEGAFKLSLSASSAVVANARVTGDLRAAGGLTIDLGAGRVTESTLTLRVPPEIDRLLKNPVFGGTVNEYLEPGDAGEWRVRRSAVPNS